MVKASNFIYAGLITVGVFAVLTVFWSQLFTATGVSIPAEHNATFNTLSDMQTHIERVNEIKTSANTESDPDQSDFEELLDVLGFYFKQGWESIKLIPKGLDLFYTMTTAGVDSASGLLGVSAGPLKTIAAALVTTALIIGVLVSTLVRKDI